MNIAKMQAGTQKTQARPSCLQYFALSDAYMLPGFRSRISQRPCCNSILPNPVLGCLLLCFYCFMDNCIKADVYCCCRVMSMPATTRITAAAYSTTASQDGSLCIRLSITITKVPRPMPIQVRLLIPFSSSASLEIISPRRFHQLRCFQTTVYLWKSRFLNACIFIMPPVV